MAEALTGAATTAVLTSTGAVGTVKSIEGYGEEVADLPRMILGDAVNAYQKYRKGDRIDHDPIVIHIEFDPDLLPPVGTGDELTITFPVPIGQASGATLVGDGYVKRREFDGIAPDELIDGAYTWRFTGTDNNDEVSNDYPAYSASA